MAAAFPALIDPGRSDRLTVVGGASFDTLHVGGGRIDTVGGAGLYTALGARWCGAEVTLVAPRPAPMPSLLEPLADAVDWVGPQVAPERLPRFEIAHRADGTRQVLLFEAGAESALSPADLPLPHGGGVAYCIGLGDPRRQLELAQALSADGTTVACGAYAGAVAEARETVRAVFDAASIFFCNREECELLFGDSAVRAAPGKLLFVTDGARGATIYQGAYRTDLPAESIAAIDPTGAGDAFAGATLACLMRGESPAVAARKAMRLAGRVVSLPGAQALLGPPSEVGLPLDPRLALDRSQIELVAARLRKLPSLEPYSFVADWSPPVGDPGALDYFFTGTAQQFGFWYLRDETYGGPVIATLAGRERKGSEFFWRAWHDWQQAEPDALRPARQEQLTRVELEPRLLADDGGAPLPDIELRLEVARAYGEDLRAIGWTPESIVARANRSRWPAAMARAMLDHVAGYKEDPLRKKSALLTVILQQRPESFLRSSSDEPMPPIVDYHVQRSCLRMGLVRVEDEALRQALMARQSVSCADELAIREASYRATQELQVASGLSMGAVDWFLFENRRRCPEMTVPDCDACPVDPVCAHDVELFQPVLRTTYY